MSNANGKISPPVSMSDIQTVLGNSSNDLETLCKANDINMWARYKPERIRDIYLPITHHTRKNNLFSLQIPWCDAYRIEPGGQMYYNMLNGRVYAILYNIGEENGWEYLKPRGDRTAQNQGKEYFRESDFGRILDDDSDPFYNTVYAQGYNHNAKLPFTTFINTGGATERLDSDGVWYEINTQVISNLVLTFYNSGGDDLHLQDFITIADYGNNMAWRPVVQLFRHWYQAGGEPWYERSQADIELAGDPFTTDPTGSWSMSIPLTNLHNNEFYSLCIGVGCCDQSNPLQWYSGVGHNLFIAPYTQQQWNDDILPFHIRFKLVQYSARTLHVTGLLFWQGGLSSWGTAGGTAPYFEINSLATGALRLTMTITKLPNQSADFVAEHGSAQTAGAVPMRIQAREMIAGESGETTYYLTPANSSGQTAQYIPIPEGSTSETVTLYATLNIANIPVGGYGEYHLYITTNDTDYVNLGYFSVHKYQYSRT